MYDVVFEKTKYHYGTVNRRSVYAEATVRMGSLKKMLWEISQSSQGNIVPESHFWCFLVNFAKLATLPFMENSTGRLQYHYIAASEYSSINSSEGSTVLVNETVHYDTKTTAYPPGIKTSWRRRSDFSLYVSVTSQVRLKLNTQRRLDGTSPRGLSGASLRRLIGTS